MCEVWLLDFNVLSCGIENFVLANYSIRQSSAHGGVMIYCKPYININKIENIDALSVEVHFEITTAEIISLNIIVIAIYRAPNGDTDIFFDKLKDLFEILSKTKKQVYIYGDFNIDTLVETKNSKEFSLIVYSYGYNFSVNEPTRVTKSSQTCLDNCLSNSVSSIEEVLVIPSHLSDHSGILTRIHNSIVINKTEIINFRPISEISGQYYVELLNQHDWNTLLNIDNVDDAFECFLNILINYYNMAFPLKCKTVHSSNKYKKWYNQELRSIREHLSFLTELSQCHQNIDLSNEISKCKKIYRNKINFSKRKCLERAILEANNNQKSKQVWNAINSTKTNTKSESVSTLTSEKFNNFFTNVAIDIFSKLPPSNVNPVTSAQQHVQCGASLFLTPVTQIDVERAIRNLSNSSAQDIFGFSNKILKLIENGISIPMTIIINKCFVNAQFPTKLKCSKVIPLHKKGNTNNLNNYRPLTIVSPFSKIIESILCSKMTAFFERNNLLVESQFGFLKGRSTIQAVTKLVKEIIEAFERSETISSVFLDLSKAFDCVSHDILLDKLQLYGIRGSSHKLIENYLQSRQQIVEYKGVASSPSNLIAGVPQGSVLGPLLFVLYINDFSYNVCTSTIQYADDSSLYFRNQSVDYVEQQIDSAKSDSYDYFAANKLSCNHEKTLTMNFSLRNTINDSVSHNFLGIHLDPKLNWKQHVDVLAKKLASIVYLIRKLSQSLPLPVTRQAYMGLFQSNVSYGILLWGNSTDSDKIFKLQKSALRSMCNKSMRDSCRPLFLEHQIMTLCALYIYYCLIYIYENKSNLVRHDSQHQYMTRHKTNYVLPLHRLSVTHNSFLNLSVKFFNKLPSNIKELPLITFKSRCKNILIKLCPYSIEEFLNCDVM